MFTRWIYIIVLVLLLAPLATVGAQSDNDHGVICGDLAEADCQILKDNATAMESVGAFMFSAAMTMDAEQGNLADGASAMNMSLNAQGSLSIDPTILAGIVELEDELEAMPNLLLSEDTTTSLDSFIGGLRGEIALELHVVADGETTDLAMHLLMEDGVFVINAGALDDLMGQPMQGADWIGLDANGIMTLLASDPSMTEALGSFEDMPADTSDLKAAGEAATTVTRLADSEIMGVAVAVFESSVELGLLADLVMGLTDPQGSMDPSQVGLLQEQLAETDLTMWQYIGLSDHYTYRTAVSMEMGSSDVEDDSHGMGSTALSLSMTMDQSNFNEPVDVEIPEDAFIIPLAMMMQMGN